MMDPIGASAAAIRAHYDVSNAFYSLWLDETLTYSCALWDGPDDARDLASAQRNKIAWHLASARAEQAERLLDIGCGWGSTLAQAGQMGRLKQSVGLTLSRAQADHINSLALEKAEVRLESWRDHAPVAPYDSLISIGAFEHFTKRAHTSGEKIKIYREFFQRCHSWLSAGGAFSLQTIAYGRSHQADPRMLELWGEIFPDSEMPRLEEIVLAARDIFEIVSLRNDRSDYARTCELWARRIRARRNEAIALIGEAKVAAFERYLKYSAFGFLAGNMQLLRFTLLPLRNAVDD